MIDYAAVLADLQSRRTNLDAAILAIEPFVAGKAERNGGGAPRKARRNGRRVKPEPKAKAAESDQDDGPGKGRKRCQHCGQTTGASSKRCPHCMESF